MAESFFSNYARLAPSANELTGRSSKYAKVIGLQKSNKTYTTETAAPSSNAPTARPAPIVEGFAPQQEPQPEATNTEEKKQTGGMMKSRRQTRFKTTVMPKYYM